MSKVTVAIPNYNGEAYLEDALRSVMQQTYQDFDVLVIDDGSTDGSWEILQEYARRHTRIRVLKNEQNLGISKTRNRLVDEISPTSAYIAFLDGDDVMEPSRLEKQITHLDAHPETQAVGSWFEYVDEELETMKVRKYHPRWSGADPRVLHMPLLAHSAATIRKEVYALVGKYDESLKGGEDYDLWLRVLSVGGCIENLQEVLTKYRVHDAQGTMLHNEHQKNGFKVRWKYLFGGFFSIRGLFVTMSIGILAYTPKSVRNTLRILAIRSSS